MPKGLKHKTWTTSNIASGPRVLCCARSWQVAWHQVEDRLSNFRHFQAIVHILSDFIPSLSVCTFGGAIWSVVAQADLPTSIAVNTLSGLKPRPMLSVRLAASSLHLVEKTCRRVAAKKPSQSFHVSQTFWMLRALGLVWARNPAAAYFKPRFISLEDQRRPISSFRAEASCRNSQSKAVSSPSPGSPSERAISVLTASMRPRTER